MSVNELQALTQRFADAFDQRDLKTFLEMFSDDVEVFDHVPYRFDGQQLFAKYLNEVVAGLASASFGFRQPSCRVYGDTVSWTGGGHFAAWEQPALHAKEIRDCFAKVR